MVGDKDGIVQIDKKIIISILIFLRKIEGSYMAMDGKRHLNGNQWFFKWVSLVAQLVKNLLAMRETWVRSLNWEDPLEKGKATHSSILAWRIPWTV